VIAGIFSYTIYTGSRWNQKEFHDNISILLSKVKQKVMLYNIFSIKQVKKMSENLALHLIFETFK